MIGAIYISKNMLKKISNHFRNRNFTNEPLIKILISKKSILENYRNYREKYKIQIAPVLKSNAYGHGLVEIAKIVSAQKPPFLVVDSLFEARTLRDAGINDQILIIGFASFNQITSPFRDIAYCITSMETLIELAKDLKIRRKFHLKIDTGMHRHGLLNSQLSKSIELIRSNRNIQIEGVCSHFADADNSDEKFTEKQIGQWNESVKIFRSNFPKIKYFHIAASAGAHYSGKIDANVCRLGIGLYGVNVAPFEKLNLKPALKMTSIIGSVKKLDSGTKVGYNLTYEAKDKTKIATVPVGYFEGIDRRLSNKGYLIIDDKFCPIVGRVCMNITMVDVSAVGDPKIGDEVIVISDQPDDKNSVENIAKLCETNPHEILVHLPLHLKRIIV